jgi:hypothetical protein
MIVTGLSSLCCYNRESLAWLRKMVRKTVRLARTFWWHALGNLYRSWWLERLNSTYWWIWYVDWKGDRIPKLCLLFCQDLPLVTSRKSLCVSHPQFPWLKTSSTLTSFFFCIIAMVLSSQCCMSPSWTGSLPSGHKHFEYILSKNYLPLLL